VKKQCPSLYNKYKRKREDDEDIGDYQIQKRRSTPGYFQYTCELPANDEKTLYEIFKEYSSIFTKHYKSLERTVYEVTWIFGGTEEEQIELVDKYIDWYDKMRKIGNHFLGLTGDKNIAYCLHPKEKYSDIFQMFTDNHLELKVKYGYYNLLPEKLCVIFLVHLREFCSKSKPHVDDCSKLLKRISRMIECSWDNKMKTLICTNCMQMCVK
jgi:hypothetical protein